MKLTLPSVQCPTKSIFIARNHIQLSELKLINTIANHHDLVTRSLHYITHHGYIVDRG